MALHTMSLAELRGVGGAMPSQSLQQEMAQAAMKNTSGSFGDYKLIKSIPAAKFYADNDTVIVAVSGTRLSHLEDIAADASILMNQLENSSLYKQLKTAVYDLQKQYEPDEYNYIGVGYSLGGAMVDLLLEQGFISSGLSYNPAIEPKNIGKESKNKRVYQEGDALYETMGKHTPGSEVRAAPKKGILGYLASTFLPKKIWDTYEAHGLKNFVGGAAEPEASLPPMLCRIGSKKRFAELINYLIPEHTTYVEPFVGSGAVYWYKDPSEKEVINDLDKDIAKTFRLIKSAPTDLSLYPQPHTKAELRTFLEHPHKDTPGALTEMIIRHCYGYMGQKIVGKPGKSVKDKFNPYNKLKHIAEYKARMAHTSVHSEDYMKIIRGYDNKNAFFFFDPPYENSGGLGYANNGAFDFEEFRNALAKMKGKWLVTINDSPYIRELFRGYHLAGVVIKGNPRKTVKTLAVGEKDRPELLITNYQFPAGWKAHKGAYLR